MADPNRWRHERPRVCAHKGHAAAVPEQTLEAFDRALALGADIVEVDVRRSRDGRLVLMHDPAVERTTNGSGAVADHTFEELKLLDAGSWFSPAFAGVRVPSAEEALRLVVQRGRVIVFDIKGPSGTDASVEDDAQLGVAEDVARLIRSHDALESAVISSFSHRALAAARQVMPAVELAPWMPEDRPADPHAHLEAVRVLGASIMIHTHSLLTNELMALVHGADIALWAWTTTDRPSLDACVAHGPDAIDGDDVVAMLGAVARRFPVRVDGS